LRARCAQSIHSRSEQFRAFAETRRGINYRQNRIFHIKRNNYSNRRRNLSSLRRSEKYNPRFSWSGRLCTVYFTLSIHTERVTQSGLKLDDLCAFRALNVISVVGSSARLRETSVKKAKIAIPEVSPSMPQLETNS